MRFESKEIQHCQHDPNSKNVNRNDACSTMRRRIRSSMRRFHASMRAHASFRSLTYRETTFTEYVHDFIHLFDMEKTK